MSKELDELVEQLALERIEENLFRGQSQDLGWGTVFGGQVLGQALSAAVQTVLPERHVHSLHAYFLRPGDVKKPIVYDVDRIRDGGSFATRRVVAIQAGEPIFNLACSFHKEEVGVDHQDEMPPDLPAPETLPTEESYYASFSNPVAERLRKRAEKRPFEMRVVDPPKDPFSPKAQPANRKIWMRARGTLPDQPSLHAYLLAYASDFGFVTTALLPHAVNLHTPGMQVASIDHVMWFHRPFRVDEWFLYAMESPSARGARGLVRGSIFTEQGLLAASTAQEGLLRMRKGKPAQDNG